MRPCPLLPAALPALALLAALQATEPAAPPVTGGAPAGTLVVLNKSDATVSLVDPADGRVLRTAPTGVGPHEAAVSPDGRVLVVCDYGAAEPGSTLHVYDLDPFAPRGTVDLGEHRRPHGIVFEDAGHVLVTAEATRSLLRVDVAAGRVVGRIDTGQETSHMVALDPRRRRAYVASIASGTVAAIDLDADAVLAQIATGAGTEGLDVTPDGGEVWAANRAEDTLSVIDAESLAVAAKIRCRGFPIRVKITPDGRQALVSCAHAGGLAVLSVAEREEVTRIAMTLEAAPDADRRLFADRSAASLAPVGILIDPSGARAWVANANADALAVVDLQAWRVVGFIATGHEPDGMAWSALPAARVQAAAPR
jgi:YVTN family beta-propeller protein